MLHPRSVAALVLAALVAGCSQPSDNVTPCNGDCGSAPDAGLPDAGLVCEPGQTICGRSCSDTATDPLNCQRCGHICTTKQICGASGCEALPQPCPIGGCPQGAYCTNANECARGCLSDTSCSAIQICEANTCVTGCRTNAACPSGDVCDQFRCRTACHQNSDCPLETICSATVLDCVPGCQVDPDCSAGRVCDEGACRAGCRADTDCSAGTICRLPQKVCTEGCRTDSECTSGNICPLETHACRPGCRDDGQCILSQVCGITTSACELGCHHSNARCPLGQVCDATDRCR